jgi:hypothetical protein
MRVNAIPPAIAAIARSRSASAGAPVKPSGKLLGDEPGGQFARAEARVLHQRGQEVDIVPRAVDLEPVERLDLQVRRAPRAWAPR